MAAYSLDLRTRGREQSLACGVGTPEPSDSTPGSAAAHLNRRVRTVRTVVWADGRGNPPSDPIIKCEVERDPDETGGMKSRVHPQYKTASETGRPTSEP